MRNFLFGIVFTLVVLVVGGFWYVKTGHADFRADQTPSSLESKFAMSALDASTDHHAPTQKNPVPATQDNLVEGAKLYLSHCAGCHGLPSNPESEFSRSFYPPVPGFFKDAPDMSDDQNFYIIQHGVRWTGMPAWNKTLSTTQTWQLVAFLASMDKLSPAITRVFEPPSAPTQPKR